MPSSAAASTDANAGRPSDHSRISEGTAAPRSWLSSPSKMIVSAVAATSSFWYRLHCPSSRTAPTSIAASVMPADCSGKQVRCSLPWEVLTVPRLNPPFRADHVGSLLRPQHLKEARARFTRNELTKEQLRAIEDDAIRQVVQKQEAIGLQSITDGEYRRMFFHIDFLQKLEGVAVAGGIATKFRTQSGTIDFAPPRLTVTGKLRHTQDIQT